MKRLIPALVLLLTPLSGWGAVELKLPDKVSGEVSDFIKVPATTNGKVVKWVVLDKGLKLFPIEQLKDTKTAVVIASEKGSYRLLAYTAAGDDVSDPQITTVVVGGEVKPPPPPAPDDSPLVKSLKTAYAKDADVDKKDSVDVLSKIYLNHAEIMADTEKSKNVPTWAHLFAGLQASAKLADLPATKITNVRSTLQTYLKGKFPSDPTKAFDDDGKKLATTVLKEVGNALKEVIK